MDCCNGHRPPVSCVRSGLRNLDVKVNVFVTWDGLSALFDLRGVSHGLLPRSRTSSLVCAKWPEEHGCKKQHFSDLRRSLGLVRPTRGLAWIAMTVSCVCVCARSGPRNLDVKVNIFVIWDGLSALFNLWGALQCIAATVTDLQPRVCVCVGDCVREWSGLRNVGVKVIFEGHWDLQRGLEHTTALGVGGSRDPSRFITACPLYLAHPGRSLAHCERGRPLPIRMEPPLEKAGSVLKPHGSLFFNWGALCHWPHLLLFPIPGSRSRAGSAPDPACPASQPSQPSRQPDTLRCLPGLAAEDGRPHRPPTRIRGPLAALTSAPFTHQAEGPWPSPLQGLAWGGKRRGRSKFGVRDHGSKGMQDGCRVYMVTNGLGFMVTWTIFRVQNHLVEVGLRVASHMSQEPWPWGCGNSKESGPKVVPTRLQNHVVWSRTFQCSVKSYVTGFSTKCYFNEFLFMRVLTRDKLEWIKSCECSECHDLPVLS